MRDLRGSEGSTPVTLAREARQSLLPSVFQKLGMYSRTQRVLALVATFTLTAVLDFLVDRNLSLFVLYLIPTLYSAWFLGTRWGYGTCLASAVVWAIDEWLQAVFYHSPLIPFWNVAGRLVALTAIVAIVSALKNSLEAQYESERRLVQQEFEIARDVQLHLLPSEVPNQPRLDVGFAYQPAREVGGDYYDLFEIDSQHFGLAVGDVSGKGVSAALLMASLQALVQTHLAAGNCEIAGSAGRLSASLYRLTTANRFATLFFGLIDVSSQTLCYVNAGHNPPLLFRNGSSGSGAAGVIERLESGGPPVGLFPDAQYESGRVSLHHGDVLVAYTDGGVEALNTSEEEFGEERLSQAVWEHVSSPAATICRGVQDRLNAFTAGQVQFDDIALLVLKLKP